jgi:hypothetical protein
MRYDENRTGAGAWLKLARLDSCPLCIAIEERGGRADGLLMEHGNKEQKQKPGLCFFLVE